MVRLFIFALGFVMSCSSGQDGSVSSQPMDQMAPDSRMQTKEGGMPEESQPAKRIRQGQLRLVCADAVATANDIRAMVVADGGFVENENEQHYGNTREVYLSLRVESSKLEKTMEAASAFAIRVENRSMGETDVSESYYDTEARLKTKKALEQRYLDLLKAAKNVEEMLAIERELHQVRADIESMETQLRSTDRQVAMSQLHISCVTYQTGGDHFFSQLKEAISKGWGNLLSFLLFLSQGWAIFLLLGLLWLLYRRWRRGRR